mgnify:CR=1 FL=1
MNIFPGKAPPFTISKGWLTMKDSCIESMKRQIQTEVNASMYYLSMGAYFSRDVVCLFFENLLYLWLFFLILIYFEVNRPGFANMFFEAASEERQHAMKLIEYLLMRTEISSIPSIKNLIKINVGFDI